MHRVNAGEVEAPRYGATIATAVLLGATAVYGTLAGGHLPQVLQSVTARTGLAIAQVHVVGNEETSEIDVLQEVGLNGWTALVGFNAEEARQRLAGLPWVEGVAVRKVYPATLEVDITEKKAFAIWQHGNELSLIEKDGSVIAPFDGGRYTALPMVIGAGAREAGPEFIAKVARHPTIAGEVRAYIRVGGRRWDLRLKNGVTIKLPETNEALTLATLAALDRKNGLLSRDITSVDMRLPDRMAIGLSEEAAEAHQETMRERYKARIAGGAQI
ncbi:cell division protein FtsQ/DivIB [Nitratireductor sp. L1-7-SE]|uniref:Cell division protein FtsQ n=2 Tax=Nitratireductor rhodophyticola TaxID=2854036 RepID=A0ABS7R4C9_9HYPH|nr:cell division protein FtsQ/DivIB [Nitratireductor rhodophyticola]MBY8915767.1 cell division protein FtsQ/DivIB [Nitratireductor rhodophyticola]MBY8919164.1 cell division protein FtsQ/DivIB [Nitratireductor rhodophyticola]